MTEQLRPIDTARYAKLSPPASFGRPPRLEWIAIAQLFIDPEYQREITGVGRRNIRHIAENFNWSMFGTVMVAAIGSNRYAIVDGQHRTTAAALAGIDKVPCQVVDAPRGEQAAAFRAINGNTTRLHTVQLFHAAVAASDPESLKVVSVCKAAGIRIPKSLQPRGEGETHCVGTIGRSIVRHGEKVVTLGLRAIMHSGGGNPVELGQTIIVSVIEVLARHPEWRDEARLFEAFEDFALEDMWRAAAARAARIKGSSTQDQLQADLTEGLAKKLTKKQVPA